MSEATTIDGIDYGPLAALIGVWKGDRGVDRAPEPGAEERNPYYETITFEAAGDVDNAEEQNLAVVRYHQVVSRKSNDKVFHDQVGYWLWDASDNTIIDTFTIPRAVAVVAAGTLAAPEDLSQELVFVASTENVPDGGLTQSAFMASKARTTAYRIHLTVVGDEMRYTQHTVLDIYEKTDYDHKDVNTLTRVG